QYYAAGNQYYTARNYAQAAKYYYAAVKINPNNGQAYQGLGNCYYALGRKADALTFYQRASALQPANAQLAQFVQNLQAQVGAAGTATAPASTNYLSQGYALFQQRQYASSIPYFQYAIQQNPNDYRPYYYAGYAYYMTGNAKSAALYFAIANAKQPNASIKAYADRVKSSLSPDDQQWVDDQAAKYTGTAVAGGPAGGSKGGKVAFGFHLLGGMEYIFADPSQIKQYVTAAQSVSLSGVTPNIVALPELEPFVQLGDSFEINLALGYFPVGNLSYTTYEYSPAYSTPPGNSPDVWKYTFNTTIITADLGLKLLFGDKSAKGYLGLSGGISPISADFTKIEYDSTGTNPLGTDSSTGTYGALAINAQAVLGVDFSLGKGIAVGPYVGYRYLDATNFQNAGSTLVIDTKTGAVGTAGGKTPAGYSNLTAGDPVKALDLDFSGIEGGLNLTFSF
ncbi:MAG TPA: tetratricopeptide repeat protein, partial [bacterium]|nr:tetratricopeptide repeat protein [bacterium]